MGLTPGEIAALHKRVKLRKLLPCVTFEELDEAEVGCDRPSDDLKLNLVDATLEDATRVVMARTRQRYLVMEAATAADKFFTASLIVLTVFGILVLFWYRNFGPGIQFTHIHEGENL